MATPAITPNGGNFSGSVSVTMQTATPGASIYYTTDGTTPTQSSSLYNGPVTLTNTATVDAQGFMSGYSPSGVASASFTNTDPTYYVAKIGSDSNTCVQARSQSTPKLTINAGIACLASGDTLIIKAGTYNDIISSLSQAIPSGSSWNAPTTIKANSGDTVIIHPTGSSFCCAVYLGSGESFIVFDGLIWDGNGASTPGGPSFKDGANYIRVQNSEFKNFADSGASSTGTGFQFVNNKSHNNGTNCPEGAGHCHGYYISSSNTLIEGNDVYNNEGYGIQAYGGSLNGTIIRRNRIHDNGIGGGAGVGPSAGMVLSTGTGIQAYNNIIWNNAAGIQIQYGTVNTLVYNNTIYNNTRSAPSTPNYCVYNGSDTSGRIFENNICYQNPAGFIDVASPPAVKSNNLMPDPLFVNPAAADFHLQSGSAAINAGAPINLVATDFDGVLRPQGPAYDIGAYEFR